MKIIDRYLLRNFWASLIYIVAACYCVLLIAEVFEGFGDMMENNTPVLKAVQYFWYAMPYKLLEVIPLTIMLAALFSIGMLARNLEILAINASGVSLMRVSMPLIVSAVAIAVAMFILNETVIYRYQELARQYERQYIENKPPIKRGSDIFLKGEGDRYYVVDVYDIPEKRMNGAYIIDLHKDNKHLKRIVYSETVQLTPPDTATPRTWRLMNPIYRTFNEQGELIDYTDNIGKIETMELEPGLDSILSVRKKPEEMNSRELLTFIRHLEQIDEPTSEYRAGFYLQLLFPLSCLVMMLIGIPFALKAQSGRTMVAGFGFGIMCAIVYYGMTALFLSLGERGVFPPWFASVIPLVVFSALGIYLIRRSSFAH